MKLATTFVSWIPLLASCGPQPPGPAPAPSAAPPPSSAATPVGEPAASGDLIAFTAPAVWTKETPSSSMRKGQYRVPDKEKTAKDAELGIFYFGPDNRMLQANLTRWAGQMGVVEPKPEALQGAHKITLVDFQGTYTGDAAAGSLPEARMLAAVVEASDGPWYFKLTGPAATVGDWKEEFVEMLKRAKR